ncbi:hypothetical protein ACFVJH_30740 [Streptomyces decoyicus]|uniref:hypothetical protein n=1 Tax=Streptomyces decoyicus TaxID=249567 RepID=UPI00362C22CE
MTPTAAAAPRTRAAARTALAAARRPADPFPDDVAAAARTRRRLARLVHPDTAPAAERPHAYALAACGGVDALAVTPLDAPARHRALRLAHGYRTPDGPMDRIPSARPGGLRRQQALTEKLLSARPGPPADARQRPARLDRRPPGRLVRTGPPGVLRTDRGGQGRAAGRVTGRAAGAGGQCRTSDRRATGKSK